MAPGDPREEIACFAGLMMKRCDVRNSRLRSLKGQRPGKRCYDHDRSCTNCAADLYG